jgi:hypothetical protein
MNSFEPKSCTLHGSYNRHLHTIVQVAALFEFAGIEIAAPRTFNHPKKDNDFVRFEADGNDTPHAIESRFLNTVYKRRNEAGFFAYFIDIDGYLGPCASFELSMAIHLNVPFFVMMQPSNVPITIDAWRVLQPIELLRLCKLKPVF